MNTYELRFPLEPLESLNPSLLCFEKNTKQTTWPLESSNPWTLSFLSSPSDSIGEPCFSVMLECLYRASMQFLSGKHYIFWIPAKSMQEWQCCWAFWPLTSVLWPLSSDLCPLPSVLLADGYRLTAVSALWPLTPVLWPLTSALWPLYSVLCPFGWRLSADGCFCPLTSDPCPLTSDLCPLSSHYPYLPLFYPYAVLASRILFYTRYSIYRL